MTFVFIAKHRRIWPVAWLCEALGVSRSGFYTWLTRSPSRRAREDEIIGAKVRASFIASARTSPSSTALSITRWPSPACLRRRSRSASRRGRSAAASRCAWCWGAVHSTTRSPDPALIGLVADAHRWFEDLRTGRAETIAELAARNRQQVSHVSRTMSLAFLAPDIIETILAGCQPITLTPERLKACRPLPLGWGVQRDLLLG